MQRTRGSVAVIEPASALPPLLVFQHHHSDSSVVITQRLRLVAQSDRCAGNYRLYGQGGTPPAVIDDPEPLGPYPLPLAPEAKLPGNFCTS